MENLLDESLNQPNGLVSLNILKPSQKINTPLSKNSKVSFLTPLRTATGHLKTSSTKDGFSFLNSKTDKLKTIQNKENNNKPNIKDLATQEYEKLKWKERIEVVTKKDHAEYIAAAGVFLDEIVSKAVGIAKSKVDRTATNIPTKSSLKHVNNISSSAISAPFDVVQGFADSDFIDGASLMNSNSAFDWDYLARKGSSSTQEPDNSKQSLFANFDPLYVKKPVKEQQPRQSDIIDFVSFVPKDTKDDRSRVTKSTVDFFFESPPALTAIEEEVFLYEENRNEIVNKKSVVKEENKTLQVKNRSGSTGLVDVLTYSGKDIMKIVEEQRKKLEEENMKNLQAKIDLEKSMNSVSIICEERHSITFELMNSKEDKLKGNKYKTSEFKEQIQEIHQLTENVNQRTQNLQAKRLQLFEIQQNLSSNRDSLRRTTSKHEELHNIKTTAVQDITHKKTNALNGINKARKEIIQNLESKV